MGVYLDWNATTPPHPDVLAAMRDASERGWGNPASIHAHGRAARSIVEDARARVAALAGVDARDVIFTAGGTEANNLALQSAKGRIITSRLEHPSVATVAEQRAEVRWLAVKDGAPDLDDLDRALAEAPTALVTIQAVNHETGIVQPVAEVIARAHAAGARVHVDAIQAWGKVEVPSGWDTVAIAAHKMRGPKGIGALATREGIKIDPVLRGGAQEKGVRPGTVDAALAAGFGKAAERAKPARWAALAPLRDELEAALVALGAISVGGPRAPHVLSTIWPTWMGAELVAALDLEGVSVSSGSACSAGTVEPSPVLQAMRGEDAARRGLRISIGDATTEADVAEAIGVFRRVV